MQDITPIIDRVRSAKAQAIQDLNSIVASQDDSQTKKSKITTIYKQLDVLRVQVDREIKQVQNQIRAQLQKA